MRMKSCWTGCVALRVVREILVEYTPLLGAEDALQAANEGNEGYTLVEIMKTREAHRKIVDLERAFVKAM